MGGSMDIIVVSYILLFRPDLWYWFSAAFPDTKYCLTSATLTDASVKDMQGFPSTPSSTSCPWQWRGAATGDLGHLHRQLLAQGCWSWPCTPRRKTVCLKSAMGMAVTLLLRTTAPFNSSMTSSFSSILHFVNWREYIWNWSLFFDWPLTIDHLLFIHAPPQSHIYMICC